MSEGIATKAILFKVSTTADGGWRMTFDVPRSDTAQVMQISALRDVVLDLVIIPEGMGTYGGPEAT